MPSSALIHGTCIAYGERAILLRGASGAGKSDLAIRCLLCPLPPGPGAQVFKLVADDQLIIRKSEDGRLLASAPESIAGQIEVRGAGIQRFPYVAAELCLVVDLVPPDAVTRLPPLPPPTVDYLGVKIPRVSLSPFEASAPLKVWLWLEQLDRAPQ